MGGSSFPEPRSRAEVAGWPRAVLPGWWEGAAQVPEAQIVLGGWGGPRDPEWSEHGAGSSHTLRDHHAVWETQGKSHSGTLSGNSQTLNLGRGLGSPGPWGDGGHGLSFSAEPTCCVCITEPPGD